MKALISDAAWREFAQGWPVTVIGALAIGVGMMGIGFYSLSLFVAPLQDEFGWSRAAVSGAATFQQLGIFVSAPVVGMLADRIGVRSIAIASYIATPLALVALSQAGPSLAAWYGLWFLVSVAGCGTTPAVWARVVTTRFDCARGLGLGVMLLGTGTAAVLAPALLGPVFAHYGWRTAVLAIAAVTTLVGLPMSLLLSRDRPSPSAAVAKVRPQFEANRATIVLQLIALLLGAIVAGLIIHLVPLLIDRGMPAPAAAQVAATIGIAVLFARVVAGYLFDRFHAPYVAALLLTSPLASALLLRFDGPVIPAALLLGLAAGVEVDMLAYFTSRYARIENYGATYGVTLGLFCLGASVGPIVFGWTMDHSGSYDMALVASAVLLVAVVGLVATLGPYRNANADGHA